MAATVGWRNEQLWRSGGKVEVESKGSQGGGKAQKQQRGRTVEQDLAVQAVEKDIKGEDQRGKMLLLD